MQSFEGFRSFALVFLSASNICYSEQKSGHAVKNLASPDILLNATVCFLFVSFLIDAFGSSIIIYLFINRKKYRFYKRDCPVYIKLI